MKAKARTWTLIVIIGVASALSALLAHWLPISAVHDSSAVHRRALQAYRKLPLSFEAGPADSNGEVKFLARGLGYALFLTSSEAVLALHKPATSARDVPSDAALRMKLVGANADTQLEGVDELPVKSNYFIGNDPAKWRVGVPSYAKVIYHQIYPGIDLIYYGNQRQLEYDFVVAPGADPRQIRFSIQGADELRVDPGGDLIATVGGDEVRLHRPVVYESAGVESAAGSNGRAGHQMVEARYALRDEHRVEIDVGTYDRSKHLIVDPVLSYSTYLGGAQEDDAYGVALDSAGNAYIVGMTSSNNFPIEGGFQTTFRGFSDAFVTKLNASGTAPLLYSTYLGGESSSTGHGIAVDNAGNAYVVGDTTSSDFPVRNGFQTQLRGTRDAFVTKLNTNQRGDASLVYSTFLGGTNAEYGWAIAIDSTGNAYVTGQTFSSNFPTKNAYQDTYAGGSGMGDAFVTRIDTTRSGSDSLVYSTYLGGSRMDEGRGIAADSTGKAYVVGRTNSSGAAPPSPPIPFPTTPGAWQTTYAGGGFDAFVAKIDTTRQGAASLIYSTFLGGSLEDDGNAIAIDSDGNAYVTGFTDSENFPIPASAGSYRRDAPGGGDAFVSKLNASGSALLYSTYLGGSVTVIGTGRDEGVGIAVGPGGLVYLTGSTRSRDFPVRNAFQSVYDPGPVHNPRPADAFITEFDTTRDGSASLIFSSYHGGSGNDIGQGIAVDHAGVAYFAGFTDDSNPPSFPTTPGVFQTNFGGVTDAFVAKVSPDGSPAVTLDPLSLNFGDQAIGSSSAARLVTLTNSGTAQLALTHITLIGTNATQFTLSPTVSTPCSFGGSSLSPGEHCTFNVVFTPTTLGPKTANVEVLSNAAGSPHLVALSGTGVAAGNDGGVEDGGVGGDGGMGGGHLTLSATRLVFAGRLIGTTSATAGSVLTNGTTGPLTISRIAISGAHASEFTMGTNCSTHIAEGTSCVIDISFTPGAVGQRTATITLEGNGSDLPQTIELQGVGQDFSVQAREGSPSALTISSSQTATYNLELIPASGFIGSVEIGCSGAPAGIACTASPSTVSVTSSASAPFTVTLRKGDSSQVIFWPSDGRQRRLPVSSLATLLLSLLLVAAANVLKRRAKPVVAPILLSLALLAVTLGTACGNNNTLVQTPESFAVTITARHENATRTTMLTATLRH